MIAHSQPKKASASNKDGKDSDPKTRRGQTHISAYNPNLRLTRSAWITKASQPVCYTVKRLGLLYPKWDSNPHISRYCILRDVRSEEHTSELQSRGHLVCRLLLEKKKPCKTC